MFKVHFLNTVWSDAMILEKDGHYAFIDTASAFYYPMIKEYCEKNNIKDIDFILLTHFHSDHYSNIKNLIDDCNVGKVYFRDYTNAEAVGSSGEEACEQYNKEHKEIAEDIKAYAEKNSQLILLDGSIKEVDFQGITIDIINPIPWTKIFYEKEDSPLYHVRRYSDNHNSVACFMQYNGHNILLGGDLDDSTSEYPELNRPLSTGIKEVFDRRNVTKVDVYKSAHHGGPGHNNVEVLKMINADYIVITNSDRWLDNWSSIRNMKEANPNSQIFRTDYNIYVFDFSEEETKLNMIHQVSPFILLGKD